MNTLKKNVSRCTTTSCQPPRSRAGGIDGGEENDTNAGMKNEVERGDNTRITSLQSEVQL